MKHISGQNTLLAVSLIVVFAISGCFFKSAGEKDTATEQSTPNVVHSTQVATVK